MNTHYSHHRKSKHEIEENREHHNSRHIRRVNEARHAGEYQQLIKPGTLRKAACAEKAWLLGQKKVRMIIYEAKNRTYGAGQSRWSSLQLIRKLLSRCHFYVFFFWCGCGPVWQWRITFYRYLYLCIHVTLAPNWIEVAPQYYSYLL